MKKWVEYIAIVCVVFVLEAVILINEAIAPHLNIEIGTIRFVFALGIIAGLCVSWLGSMFAWKAEILMRKKDENKKESL